eukprot:TRINITY_DN2271_c0_g2_i1.p1 TRINITY_DN2271_c0_g2~~TRINITY_DN2271_c0_g2_i1.p1  ORF type:complete len:437 (-),score=73.26 TRINITY_DN2271_c0_g2_i1:242-1552(-)
MAVVKSNVLVLLVVLVVVAFVIFLSKSPPPDGEKHLPHRRMSRRSLGPRIRLHNASGPAKGKLDHITFDPQVAEIERIQEDLAWEREVYKHHHEEQKRVHEAERHARATFAEAEESDSTYEEESEEDAELALMHEHDFDDVSLHDDPYVQDDYEPRYDLNVTYRLMTLFPEIDTHPPARYISVDELTEWQLLQARRASMHRSDRELEAADQDGDGKISLKEYTHDAEPNVEHDNHWVKIAEEQFPLADLDKDGLLDPEEFNDFLHPEDSENEDLHRWLRMEELRSNEGEEKDGKLSFDEFNDHLFNSISDEDEYGEPDVAVESFVIFKGEKRKRRMETREESRLTRAKTKFHELDVNEDGFLTEVELIPLTDKIWPGERVFSKQQAEHMVEQTDENKDGLLTLEEMLRHPYVFYNVAYDDDSHEDESFHDEFRRRR